MEAKSTSTRVNPPPLTPPPPELLGAMGRSLRRLRVRRGYTLERLAALSKVSRAMLSQIELAQSAPSITILWRIAAALEVPFSALLGTDAAPPVTLLRAADATRFCSESGGLLVRALSPKGKGPRHTEFYEFSLAPHADEPARAHPPGTLENVFVARGRVCVRVLHDEHRLAQGDAIEFQADVEHAYVNDGDEEARAYVVRTYLAPSL